MKRELKVEDLQTLKKILSDTDDSIVEQIKIKLGNDFPAIEKRTELVTEAISGTLTLDAKAFAKVIQELIVLQNTATSESIIKKVSDIKSQDNFSDYITFTDDEKQYYVIGDLHADLNSFLHILEAINFKDNFDNINLIFLGDYVDRGKDKIELINRIILLKYLLPNKIHLLRGNHELYRKDTNENYLSPMLNADMSYLFNFLTLLATDEKYKSHGVTKEFIKLYADFFDSMPTIALFNFKELKICAMHGGPPRVDLSSKDYYGSKNYESFNKLLDKETKDDVGITQKINILWSDPFDGYSEAFKSTSEVRYDFSKNQFIAFCKKYDIDMLLRAHEQHNDGYKSYFNERLISVFSSGGKNIDGQQKNPNSYYENVSPNFLKITKECVESININFDTDDISSIEQEYKHVDTKISRDNNENEYKTYIPKKLDTSFEDILGSEGVINIIDRHNKSNKKVIIPKDDNIILNYNDLKQFSGINMNLKLSINKNTKTITNLCDLNLMVGIGGSIIKKDQTINVEDKFIISDNNAFSLIITT